ncbi:NADH dehydrogenase [ubiquinone] 1 alpha subcomplex subunit 7-like [Orussus abietinus]|uniref:NADH dehydrogenase [ubiquinone] 1 alpha subcomplex subunit 7-like n=1 Tax=Orussus abietinus TaxID=222816 RepID=UPI0006255F26|nr:NADH dehydrogenase [ubiquinone] 1 alpha subcomplex subunit 7-like [Orussus abietinus]XP_012288496.1 NADH dehydrogenase [ubiquinone] 1 alpha subcomplex subunit 7-like [Orussus abietinus]
MATSTKHRSVTPFLAAIRKFLRGKGHTNSLRFADLIAARDQPPPDVPGGPYHKTTDIYYFTRDARREVKPPTVLELKRQIESGDQAKKVPKLIAPGKKWDWD